MLLYNLAVRSYGLAIRTAALSKTKASQWVEGRKNWENRLRDQLSSWDAQSRIWVHCASYGEFEQGRPVIEALKKKYPGHKLLLSFFSPSGYESFYNWEGADAVCYLPLDTKKNAATFIEIVSPSAVLFIKYEFWLNYLNLIRKKKIPCYLVSAVFKLHHPFFKWYGAIFRRSLRTFSLLFIQDEQSGNLLKKINITNFEVCGDTRFDRVLQIRDQLQPIHEIGSFKGDAQLIIAGSTWPDDEDLVIDAFKRIRNNRLKLLLVPHDIDKKYIQQTVEKLQGAALTYSLFTSGIQKHSEVLVLDTMGMLARSYHYADCAYIGGGFDGGLHNSLEAAVFGVPVTFFGNDYTKFNEAVELLALGAAENVKKSADLAAAWQRFLDKEKKKSVAATLGRYFEKNRDSTARIISHIEL